ncbi:MAG: cache domain-containing protein [Desulfoprunum sp.]|uniref:cache domain-containing protein n=1 Tax=Desulfoprunum sp. TaxID=2020866 RepID=UPI003C72AE27
MERKREMIHALSEAAMGSISYYAKLAERRTITVEEAKKQAAAHLRSLRYGPEGKDYFWINDTHPRMIMHPYRADLEGKDVTNTKDPAGKKLFQAFLETVKDTGGGYVDYHRQWQDDPSRIFSKISYVQEYRPWHWSVGTGVYVEDVRAQIAAITKRMTFIFLGILGVIALLSVYVVWQGAAGETHRREIEESLRQSENKYRLLAETAREIILLFDSNLCITYANTAWKRISGYLPEEMTEVNITDLIPVPQRSQFAARLERIHDNQADDYLLLETNFILKDHRMITVEATIARMESADNSPAFLMTVRDITEKKRVEAQARMRQEQLMQTNKMVSLGTLVSGVAHEINNPISSVMLNSQVFDKFWRAVHPILDRHHEQYGDLEVGPMAYPQMRERMPRLLHFSQEGVERVKRIVGDLKEFPGQRPADLRETVNLNQVVEKAIGLTSSLIRKAADDLQVEYDENLPTFQGNSQRLGQVVVNMVVNACQALTEPNRSLCIATGYLEESEEIYLKVQDSGRGMTAEVLAQAKDPFFTTRRDSGGTGLGLSISDTIIRNHGGWLDFSSEPRKGTTATILLPRYSQDEVIGRMI